MLKRMDELVMQSPGIRPRQVPEHEGAAKQHEHHRRMHEKVGDVIERDAGPGATDALPPARGERPDEGNSRAAPDEKRGRHHHQQNVLEHMHREQLAAGGVDRRAQRKEDHDHAGGKGGDVPAVEHALGAGLAIEPIDAEGVQQGAETEPEQNPRLEAPGETGYCRLVHHVRERVMARPEARPGRR